MRSKEEGISVSLKDMQRILKVQAMKLSFIVNRLDRGEVGSVAKWEEIDKTLGKAVVNMTKVVDEIDSLESIVYGSRL